MGVQINSNAALPVEETCPAWPESQVAKKDRVNFQPGGLSKNTSAAAAGVVALDTVIADGVVPPPAVGAFVFTVSVTDAALLASEGPASPGVGVTGAEVTALPPLPPVPPNAIGFDAAAVALAMESSRRRTSVLPEHA